MPFSSVTRIRAFGVPPSIVDQDFEKNSSVFRVRRVRSMALQSFSVFGPSGR